MNNGAFAPEGAESGGAPLLAAVADDLALLARLHDRELDAVLLTELRARPSREWLALSLSSPEAAAGFQLLDGFMAKLAEPVDHAMLDLLAVDFADLYLTFGKRLSPSESHWLTEDHLERQAPMFEVRTWYARYGLAAKNWRTRADDHLVHQLEFVAALMRAGTQQAVGDASRFLDQHLLRWSKAFFGGVASRADTELYAGMALVTQAHVDATRQLLAVITNEPPTAEPELGPHRSPSTQTDPTPRFVPGVGPGW